MYVVQVSLHAGVTYNCNTCQYRSSEKSYLAVHIKSVHLKEKPYTCGICDFAASVRCNLSHHVKNVHQKSEKIICTECNISIQKKNMPRHMKKLHSGEQSPYHCEFCIFQTVHRYSLKMHVQNVHKYS